MTQWHTSTSQQISLYVYMKPRISKITLTHFSLKRFRNANKGFFYLQKSLYIFINKGLNKEFFVWCGANMLMDLNYESRSS